MAAGRQGRELPADALVLGTVLGLLLAGLALRFLPLSWVAAGLAGAVLVLLLLAAMPGLVRLPRLDWLDGGTMVLLALALGLVLLVLAVNLPVGEGEAVLTVGLIATVGSLVEYRRRLDERRGSVAVALAAEILVNARATLDGIGPEVMADLAGRSAWHRPFIVPVPPDYPVYAGNQEALGLLPAAAVRHVVAFYETDEFMTQAYNVLGTPDFHALERRRRNALYAHITRRMREEYLPVALAALEALGRVAGEEIDPAGMARLRSALETPPRGPGSG